MRKWPVALAVLATLEGFAQAGHNHFGLRLRQFSPEAALACPGGAGARAFLQAAKPKYVKAEPSTVSSLPLYGWLCPDETTIIHFLLDESSGNGKGYDRLIVAPAGTNSFVGARVYTNLANVPSSWGQAPDAQRVVFGPIPAPKSNFKHWRPGFYAYVTVPNLTIESLSNMSPDARVGELEARAAAYLEAVGRLGRQVERFGLVDGNCNFKIGEGAVLSQTRSSAGAKTAVLARDYILRATNGADTLASHPESSRCQPFMDTVEIGGIEFDLSFTSDGESLCLARDPASPPAAVRGQGSQLASAPGQVSKSQPPDIEALKRKYQRMVQQTPAFRRKGVLSYGVGSFG